MDVELHADIQYNSTGLNSILSGDTGDPGMADHTQIKFNH